MIFKRLLLKDIQYKCATQQALRKAIWLGSKRYNATNGKVAGGRKNEFPIFAASKKFFPEMISRRNIRVKVMQELYAKQSGGSETGKSDPVADLQNNWTILHSFLFIFFIF